MSKDKTKNKTKIELFLELAKPNEEGVSRIVYIKEFTDKYQILTFGNGGDWCRRDGALARKYKIKTITEGNKIVAIQLEGFNPKPISKTIKNDIKKVIYKKRCVILFTSKPECDHKYGGSDKDSHRSYNPHTQKEDDFQPLSKAANDAKRQHCKICQKKGIRFDARQLGYNISYIEGDKEWQGNCEGCYWYDPFKFNGTVSSNFKSKKQ